MQRYLLLLTTIGLWLCAAGAGAQSDRLAGVRAQLETLVHERIAAEALARADGYVYTIDLSQLLIYAAQAGDAPLYDMLRDFAVTHLIVDQPSDPYTAGFVGWRVRPGEPLDASGTTEALRVAEGLWRGADRFDRPDDRALARRILHGYARHEAEEQGIWLIRNYFNFGTRAFATNTYLIDYHPDFVALAAGDDAALQQVAQQSYELVRGGVSPAGLLYDLIQPEIKTLIPDLDIVAFSPNDIIQLSNSCAVAETVVRGDRATAERTLDFALARVDDLRKYYLGRTGEPASDQHAGNPEWTCLLRLAATLNRVDAVNRLTEPALAEWERMLQSPDALSLYEIGQTLLTLQSLQMQS